FGRSLREGRRYRKLAEMYWALALGEESHSVRSLKMSEIVMTTYPTEFHRRFEQKWNIVLTLRRFMRAHGECLGCWEIGRTLRADRDAAHHPAPARAPPLTKDRGRPPPT